MILVDCFVLRSRRQVGRLMSGGFETVYYRGELVVHPQAAPLPYRVVIDDNFHYMDPDHQSVGPQFATLEEAVAHCKRIVDDFLIQNYHLGMPPYELLTQYLLFGEDPFVRGGEGGVPFSARDYAATWIREVYGEWQLAVCKRDHPLLSRLIAAVLAPVVWWRIGRRSRRPADG